MSKTNRRVLALGVAAMLVGLVVSFPARLAYQWFAPPGVGLSGIEGTPWHGRAAHAEFSGLYARELRWRFRPLAVFTGKAGFAIDAALAPGNVSGNVALGAGGSLVATDVTGTIPLQALGQVVNMPGLQGRLDVTLERLEIDDGLPVAADGVVRVSQLVAPPVHRGTIGGYRIELYTQAAGVMASVEDTDGVVDLAGTLEIARDGNYVFDGLVAPKAATPARLRDQMQFLGTANDRGQYELRFEGSL